MRADIYGLTYDELKAALSLIGEKPSRAELIFRAVYADGIKSFDELPFKDETKKALTENFFFGSPECVEKLVSDDADKYLFRLRDGNMIETVLMKHEFGRNVCVSTQVGCNMGCKFCRSGRLRKVRDLTAGEIAAQVMYLKTHEAEKISGIAIMGIGEPLDNLGNVLGFIGIMTHPKGLNIGIKHITLSTCGIVPGIIDLIGRNIPVNLAISLHAPNDELRAEIMPIAKRYELSQLMMYADNYSKAYNRRITLEYVMLDGVNDSDECARELAALIGKRNCYVNIIRYNPSDGDSFGCSPHERIMSFYDILKKNGIGVTMRRELGASVNAACGQLRAVAVKKKQTD